MSIYYIPAWFEQVHYATYSSHVNSLGVTRWKVNPDLVNYKPYTKFNRNFHRGTVFSRFTAASYVSKHLTNYPAPASLNLSWTFGSLTFFALIIQIITGFFLSMHYTPSIEGAFDSVEHIMREVNYGYAMRYTHANGASFYFVCLYCHIFRSLYYKTFIKNGITWQVGVVILLLSMATAFLGYVLPWGQMSFWGATVITNLFSVVPFIGTDIVHSMWGGFSVSGPTLNRFYSLHFILPLIVLWLVIIHILLLHEKGSSTPNNILYGSDRVSFYGFFGIKDLFLITFCLLSFISFLVFGPNILNHPDNYNPADPMQTPPHIVPEWYFLPFYAILRAIPNKVLGVLAMAGSILVLLLLPLKRKVYRAKCSNFSNLAEKLNFWCFIVNVLVLGYYGGMPIEWPFNLFSVVACYSYFLTVYALAGDVRLLNMFLNYLPKVMKFEMKTVLADYRNEMADTDENYRNLTKGTMSFIMLTDGIFRLYFFVILCIGFSSLI